MSALSPTLRHVLPSVGVEMVTAIWKASLLSLAAIAFAGVTPSKSSPLFETTAPQALLVEAGSGSVLFAKAPDQRIEPASLAKLMTMEVVFDALRKGEVSLQDEFVVSEDAWRRGGAPSGGSTMFAALGSRIALSDLIQGVVVQSANDGCIIIAEGMAGSEEAFVVKMNERARAIGLRDTIFKNATGLPAEGQVVTLRDLVTLARHIWRTYPDRYPLYAQADFTWNKILQRNRNPLLRLNVGADGMGTGFTETSGYAMVGSVDRGNMRLFAALGGMTSEKERAEESRKIIEWGLQAFERVQLFDKNSLVGKVEIFGGTNATLALRTEQPISVFMPVDSRDAIEARIIYEGPIPAPVKAGSHVADLEIWISDTLSAKLPLVASEDVTRGTLGSRAADAMQELAIGWIR